MSSLICNNSPKKRKKLSVWGITSAFLLLMIAGCVLILDSLNRTEESVLVEVNQLFNKASMQDYDTRIEKTGFYYFNTITHDWPHEEIKIMSENGMRTQSNIDSIRDLPLKEKIRTLSESGLLHVNPINPDTLNACFQQILRERDLSIPTAIRYTEAGTDKTLYSGTDTTIFATAYPLKEFKTGVFGEIAVQAYVGFPVVALVGKAGLSFWSPACFLLVCLILYTLYIVRLVKKRRAENAYHPEWHVPWMDKAQRRLYYKGQVVKLTTQQSQLMALFLERPGYFVTKKEISDELWGKIDDPSNRISQIISSMRSSVIGKTDMKVEAIRGVGFRLVVPALAPVQLPESVLIEGCVV